MPAHKNTMDLLAKVPDWSRERPRKIWDPGRRLLKSIRKYQLADQRMFVCRWILKKYWTIQHRFWSVVTGAEIDLNAKIEGGLLIPHPNGIVIHPDVRVGCNCLIFQQVTLGASGAGGVPTLGGHIDVGAGAKILGSVSVGDHAVIGANAVVLENVPPNTVAVGIPASARAKK